MAKCVGKRGDTLIEVMLAVGIFSMVAVAVVAVMSSGTTSAQTALETTLTREEVDSQAEALRFIHSAYIADKNTGASSKFGALWKEITSMAYNDGDPATIEDKLTNFAPEQCQDLYSNGGEAWGHGFVINTRKLGTLKDKTDFEDVVVSGKDNLQTAATYPHLIFESDRSLVNDSSTTLNSAAGIYIIAVKDPVSTAIVGSKNTRDSAYFDFYIRSCWYGSGDQTPSTISTVMRLYDPDAVKEIEPAPELIDPMENEDYLADYGEFASITFNNNDAVSYGKIFNNKALASFLCFKLSDTNPNRSYFGPILVGTDPNFVAYHFSKNGTAAFQYSHNSFTQNGKEYFYNAWVYPDDGPGWVEVSSCSDAKEALDKSDSKIKRMITLYTPMSGEEATKKAAQDLLQQASSK